MQPPVVEADMSSTVVVLAEPEPTACDEAESKPSPKANQPAQDSSLYFEIARTPIASLLFVLPFLLVYELGVYFGGQSLAITRNPADSWMRLGLFELGITRPWVLPALVIGTLVMAGLWRRKRIEFSGQLMVGMMIESVVAAWVLVAVGQAMGMILKAGGLMSLSGDAVNPAEWAAACVGAGLYEETLFRLWGLPIVYLAMRAFLVPKKIAFWTAIGLTAVVFASAHYWHSGFHGSVEEWYTFSFRLLAGLTFAGLLVKRGFGVAVGTHVIYDATVLLLLATNSNTG